MKCLTNIHTAHVYECMYNAQMMESERDTKRQSILAQFFFFFFWNTVSTFLVLQIIFLNSFSAQHRNIYKRVRFFKCSNSYRNKTRISRVNAHLFELIQWIFLIFHYKWWVFIHHSCTFYRYIYNSYFHTILRAFEYSFFLIRVFFFEFAFQ